MRIAIHGAAGRMGQSVLRLAASEGASVVGAIVSPHSQSLGQDAGEVAGMGILGVETTADAASERLLDEAAKVVPVLWAPNTSVGVQVLAELVALAAQKLGLGFDVEIVETHHRAKVDAPSGTAGRLREAVEEARAELSLRAVHGREGNVGPRRDEEIGVLAVRGGDVIGDHTVHFLGQGERLELTHRATSRELFARGALRAARYVAGKPAGRYTMVDVIGGG